MRVLRSNFKSALTTLAAPGRYSLDTETTGLRLYQEDRLFSVIIGSESGTHYFNFLSYPDLDPDYVLTPAHLKSLQTLFDDKDRRWYLHNAKFDMAALAKEGLFLRGEIHDTEVTARLIRNDHIKYGLAECAERIGLAKDDAARDYILKHKLWQWEEIPGKKGRVKRMFFDQVPYEIMSAYGEKDAEITYKLGEYQYAELQTIVVNTAKSPLIWVPYENEMQLTKTCFDMEQTGIQVNLEYCRRAAQFEMEKYESAAKEFEEISKIPFIDSNKVLAQAFTEAGESYPKTDLGNPSFTDSVLSRLTSPLAKVVQRYREAYKKANTYYRNFIYFADGEGVIHAGIRQAGTGTGRFSYGEPNLQNLPKEEDSEAEFLVRRAFVPRPEFHFVAIDYKQMEYRMLLEYAGEMDVIADVNNGLDVHDSTAKMMGVDRKTAKTLNFMLLYGGGAQKLADALGVSLDKAKRLKWQYFDALPKVSLFIRGVMSAAEKRTVRNWFGRIYHFEDAPEFSYKAPNYIIQGGCADVVKSAMNRLADYLADKKSRMLVQVHDEILFEIHDSESTIVTELQKIMETAYPFKYVPLLCSVSYSRESWADMAEGLLLGDSQAVRPTPVKRAIASSNLAPPAT